MTGNTVSTGTIVDSELSVFPNPATELINIVCTQCKPFDSFKLISMDGRSQNIHYTKHTDISMAMNVSDVEAGTYILEIFTSERRHLRKVVILK